VLDRDGVKREWSHYKDLFREAKEDLKIKGRRHKQIPNIITSTRIVAAPFFIIPAAIVGNVPLIIIFSIVFSLTDALDGFIARHFHLTSELGKTLDAVCDKIFAGVLLIAASIFNPLMLLNLGLEGVIAYINTKAQIDGGQPRSSLVGKAKTCVLYPLLGVSILQPYLKMVKLYQFLLIATTCMQLLTIAGYSIKYDKKELKKEEDITNIDNKLEVKPDNKSNSKVKSMEKKTTNSDLEALKEMREILQHEIEITREIPKINDKQKRM
jgi:cardiolipin synthase